MARSQGLTLALATLLPWCAAGVLAQELTQEADVAPAARRTISVQPRVAIKQTYTSNVRLVDVGAQSDSITELSPGIMASVEASNLKAFFDYTASEVLYANSPASQRVLNSLNTFGTLEAVSNWAYLDFTGSIGQQAISAFGTQSDASVVINANQTEVATYWLSPHVRGHFGDAANYEARLSQSVTHSATAGAGSNASTTDASARLSSTLGQVGLGWSVDASSQIARYAEARSTHASRINLGLPYAFTPQFSASVIGGTETNNLRSEVDESFATSGVGLTWSPSELTRLSALQERRSFGDAHTFTWESRTARTAWKFSDTKDTSAASGQAVGAGTGNVYALLYDQFASLQPDPLARAQLVSSYLQANGINPNATVTNGYLTSSQALQRKQELSFALLGIRDTITVIAMQSETTNLELSAQGGGDLANGAVLQQRGLNVSYAHRLTPDTSLGLALSQQVSTSSSLAQDARMDSVKTYLTRRLSGNALLTLELRHVVSSSVLSYTETAVSCSLNVPI
jgi:uncharacterized protein (PEP-CTERM system associated)